MPAFAQAHVSTDQLSADTWRELCVHALAAMDDRPHGDLGFIYLDHSLADQADLIVDYLRERTAIRHWVGGAAMGLCSSGLETYERPALAVLATDIGEDQLRIMPTVSEDVGEFLDATRNWREQNGCHFGVVHGDPSCAAIPQLVESLSARMAPEMGSGFLVGGLTSGEGRQVQIADRAVDGGLSGVLLGGELQVSTGLSQGCSLIGERHVVTQAQRNIVVSIDDRPALDVMKEDIGEVLARDLQRIGGYIFVALPIPGSDTGDYLVRNLMGIDPDQGLIAIGELAEEGMELQFARRDGETARADLANMVAEVRKRAGAQIKGALYHSCLGRGRYLFGDDSAELKLVREHLGDVPLIGFYANGEISHHRLYGYTGVLTVFTGP